MRLKQVIHVWCAKKLFVMLGVFCHTHKYLEYSRFIIEENILCQKN